MPVSTENFDKYLDLIEELFINLKGVIKVNDQKKDKFYSVLFLCKFFELIYDINVLIKAGRLNSVPILFRAALEVSFDIKNILKSDNYLDKLAYFAAKGEIKRLKSLCNINQKPPSVNVKDYINTLEEIISNIPEACHKEVQIKDKFKKIEGNDILHTVVYSKLCKETHSNIIEIEKHFLKLIKGKYAFVFDVSTIDLDKNMFINGIVLTILETIITVAKITEQDTSEYESQLDKIIMQLDIKQDIIG